MAVIRRLLFTSSMYGPFHPVTVRNVGEACDDARVFVIEQHTADIRIVVEAATVERLFKDALLGLMDVIGAEPGAEVHREEVRIDSVDQTALLVDFLNEVLLRCHLHRQRYAAARFASLTATSLVAELDAVPGGDFHEDVKAVTYHEANVRHHAGKWTTTLVLDI